MWHPRISGGSFFFSFFFQSLTRLRRPLSRLFLQSDVLLIAARKKNHDLKVDAYPQYEEKLINFQSSLRSEKTLTDTLLANRQKVQEMVEKERERRELAREAEET